MVDGKFIIIESINDIKETDFGYSIGCSTWQTYSLNLIAHICLVALECSKRGCKTYPHGL